MLYTLIIQDFLVFFNQEGINIMSYVLRTGYNEKHNCFQCNNKKPILLYSKNEDGLLNYKPLDPKKYFSCTNYHIKTFAIIKNNEKDIELLNEELDYIFHLCEHTGWYPSLDITGRFKSIEKRPIDCNNRKNKFWKEIKPYFQWVNSDLSILNFKKHIPTYMDIARLMSIFEIAHICLPHYYISYNVISWTHGHIRSGEPYNKNKKKDGFIMSELTEERLGYFIDMMENLLKKSELITLSIGIHR